MQAIFLVFLFVLGACVGSFLCCQARRPRLKEKGEKPLGQRSVCPKCRYQLKWYDNLPIISWFILKGRCRKCRKKIGLAEITSEILMALSFVAIGTTISPELPMPLVWIIFILSLVFVSSLGFLAIYDGLYGELPSLCLTFSIICAIIIVILREWTSFSGWQNLGLHLGDLGLSIAVLGGLYFILYKVPRGKWVGDGDWILGLAIAIALGHPWLCLIVLFISNLLACLVMLPFIKKTKKIHFGPFLVAAYIITATFANFFLSVI